MLTLQLLRHGKAIPHGAARDFDRTLTAEGEFQSQRMGHLARQRGLLPTLIISSTAARAQGTAQHFCKGAGLEANAIQYADQLYEAQALDYLQVASGAGQTPRLMLVGHNPTISDVVDFFTNEYHGSLPLAGLVIISFDISQWGELTQGIGSFQSLLEPSLPG